MRKPIHVFITILFLIISFGDLKVYSQTMVGQINANGALLYDPKSIDLFGNYAIIASAGSNALEIIDVTDPANPVHKSSIKSGPNLDQFLGVSSVVVSGNLAFAVNGFYLSIIDISNPAAPSFKSSTPINQYGLCQNCSSIYVVGNYAYILDVSLLIFDISNPSAPVLAGAIQTNDSFMAGAFSGSKAYLTTTNALKIVDVSNPAKPIINGTISDGDGGASLQYNQSVAVSGTHAYVASSNGNAVEVVDISNPTSPVHAGSIIDAEGGAMLHDPQSITVTGNLAYVASTFSGALEILDISNPNYPIHKSSVTGLTSPNFLVMRNNLAYVTGFLGNALDIIDVSNPVAPSHIGNIVDGAGGSGAILNGPSAVAVSGNYAYVASTGSNALEIVDISNPALPTHKSSLFTAVNNSIFTSANLVYLLNYNGLEIIDASNPSSPYVKGLISNGQGGAKLLGANSVFVKGNYAYVINSNLNAFEILDISDPSAPTHKGSLANGAGGAVLKDPFSLVVVGNYAYITDFISNAVEIIDVSNPTSPTHAGSISNGQGGALLQNPNSIAVSGNYIYVVSSSSNGLEIMDISNPTSPSHVGSIKDGQYGAKLKSPQSVSVANNYAFVRTQYNLEVVDVNDPKNPRHAGSLPIFWGSYNFLGNEPTDVQGNYAYMTGNNGLEVVSIFSPTPVIATNAAPITSSGFTANWNVVSGAISYQVDVSSNNFSTFTNGYNAAPISGTSLAITGLNANTIYQYRVRAVDANGTSLNSNIVSVTTLKSSQSIVFGPLSNKTYGDVPFTLGATADSQLAINYTSSDTTVAKVKAGLVTIVGAGSTTITAKQEGNAIYLAASDVAQTLTVRKATQSITFSLVPTKTVGDTAFHVSATATSQLAINYTSSDTTVAKVKAGLVTIVGVGSTTITAKQEGNDNYFAASDVAQTLTVRKATQSITFSLVPTKTVGDTAFHVSATATSKIAVALSSSSKNIMLSGNKVTIISAGSATIIARQGGDINYDSAASVSQTFCINPLKPTINLTGANSATPTLSSNSASGNQWFFNGNAITGATNQTLTVSTPGSYTVQVTVDVCSSKPSDVQLVVITEVSATPSKESGINLFPNPANGSIAINLENLLSEQQVNIQLYDMLGHIIKEISSEGGNVEILDLASYAQGTYIIRAIQSGTLYHGKFYKK